MLEALFERNNLIVDTAINGQCAYELVLQSKQNKKKMYDLIVMDLNMPVTDGFEACDKISKLYNKIVKGKQKVDKIIGCNKKNKKSSSGSNKIDLNSQGMPIMIAVSGFIDDNIKK